MTSPWLVIAMRCLIHAVAFMPDRMPNMLMVVMDLRVVNQVLHEINLMLDWVMLRDRFHVVVLIMV